MLPTGNSVKLSCWYYETSHAMIMLNKNTQGAKKGEANQKQQLSSR